VAPGAGPAGAGRRPWGHHRPSIHQAISSRR